jgi:hypothetical protein
MSSLLRTMQHDENGSTLAAFARVSYASANATARGFLQVGAAAVFGEDSQGACRP